MDYKIFLLSLLVPKYVSLYVKPYKFIPYTRAIFNEDKSGGNVNRSISHKHMNPQEYEEACDDLKKYYEDLDEYYRDLKKRLSDINKNGEDDESGEYLLPL